MSREGKIAELEKEYNRIPKGDDLAYSEFYERNRQLIDSINPTTKKGENLLLKMNGEYGLSLQRNGRCSEAIKILNLVISKVEMMISSGDKEPTLNSYLEHLLWSKGVCLFETERVKESEIVFNRLVEMQPDNDRYLSWKNAAKAVKYRKLNKVLWGIAVVFLLLNVTDFFEKIGIGVNDGFTLSIVGFVILLLAGGVDLYIRQLTKQKNST